MLKFRDHIFDTTGRCTCCVDAKIIKDPTDTQMLRKKFVADFRRRVNQLRVAVNGMVNKQDILGLKGSSMMQVAAPGIVAAATRQEMFQRWFNQAFLTTVYGNDGSWLTPYIQRAYLMGSNFANSHFTEAAVAKDAGHRIDALTALARMELQGIGQAASQQATRVANLGITTHTKPMDIVRGVQAVLERTLFVRAQALVNMVSVKAFGDGSLDIYEARGVATVGLVPESQSVVNRDAKAQPKKKIATQDAPRRQGPGSRVSRKGAGPSQRTIQRIRAAELRVAKAVGENVNVRTAGDDNVCPICEGIAEDGPYTINTARSLIPAHPNCRCVFVPADDARFASTDDSLSVSDKNPNKHPMSGKFTSGPAIHPSEEPVPQGFNFSHVEKVKGEHHAVYTSSAKPKARLYKRLATTPTP